jgi:hypothetical protein
MNEREWPQDYVWPTVTEWEVGNRVWIDTEHTFFDAIVTEVGEQDADGSFTVTLQRFPDLAPLHWCPIEDW